MGRPKAKALSRTTDRRRKRGARRVRMYPGDKLVENNPERFANLRRDRQGLPEWERALRFDPARQSNAIDELHRDESCRGLASSGGNGKKFM